ncbi:dipeptidase PepV [Thermanaerosceptrum fracticalcis]|uniref:Dipeptidase PepV n=1 Tax=Thermanaerosceptrum fracticalcis TaxID=1712410 RepID=A0A7G6DYX9_THEFR|nr:dipeptidase PepV [Thermanaerosceptrum fracticalcis]QNB45033.1 dipeptidase PepV [Thermanaerosceptrum fracticalcis]
MEIDLDRQVLVYREQIVKHTSELVRIKSILEQPAGPDKPFGEGIDEALQYVLRLGEELGLKTKNVDGYAGYVEIGEGAEMVAALCHVDVVPEGDGWKYPPYEGQVVNGKVYGRGALDDKGPLIACLFAMKAIKDTNLNFGKRVRLIIGTDEETGGRCIKHYLENEERPLYGFSPDAEFPVIYAEKGILRFELEARFSQEAVAGSVIEYIKGGTRANVVPDYAEARYKTDVGIHEVIDALGLGEKIKVYRERDGVLIKSYGISAHASLPHQGENAIGQLVKVLSRLELKSGEMKEFLAKLDGKVGMGTDGKGLDIKCSDAVSGPLTLNIGIIDLSPSGGKVVFDVRYPVTADFAGIWASIQQGLADQGTEVNIANHKPPLYVDKDKPPIAMLQRAYQEVTGLEPTLLSIGGGTYCRYVENTVAFGPVFPGQMELAHQVDEYISTEDLAKIARIYAQALYLMAR